ncbi:MAG TPA: sigma-70 family RNA polymerase sigma factor [Candidatus Dormibacteraeota bacterium]|jgi:RNA polymerase sigma-70 factor (ECF subfamily)|nr:sigma-70 family RNA polymerase sigma factor [Candidatus Dormibacteraeota bacterium]
MDASTARLEVLQGTGRPDEGEAWAWLRDAIAEHGAMLWRFVIPRVAGAEHVADGICQETWQALARQPVAPREMGAWLRGTARHKILDQYRRERRRTLWEVPLGLFQGTGDNPETVLEAHWESEQVYAALRRLPVRSRQLLVLHYIEGWSLQDLAALERRSVKAVECQLYRSRAAFRIAYTRVTGDG